MPKLLVPVDGSKAALDAVRFAAHLCHGADGGEVHLLNVQHPLPSAVTTFVSPGVVASFHHEEAEKVLHPASQILGELSVPFQRHVSMGSVPECILHKAEELGASRL